jgi:hypothetical protein
VERLPDPSTLIGRPAGEIRRIVDGEEIALILEDEPAPPGWPRIVWSQVNTAYTGELREGWPRRFPRLVWAIPALRRRLTIARGPAGRVVLVQWLCHDVIADLQTLSSRRDPDVAAYQQSYAGFVFRRGRTLWGRPRVYPIACLRFDHNRTCTDAKASWFGPAPRYPSRKRVLAVIVASGAVIAGATLVSPLEPRALFWGLLPVAVVHFAASVWYVSRFPIPCRWIACLASLILMPVVAWLIAQAWL